MAMIRIKKGKKKLKVAESAYKNFYKSAGWEVVAGNSKPTKPAERKEEVVDAIEDSDEEWDEVLEDEPVKPLSEMNRDELEAYAEKLNVNLAGLSTNKQIREAIKAAMQ